MKHHALAKTSRQVPTIRPRVLAHDWFKLESSLQKASRVALLPKIISAARHHFAQANLIIAGFVPVEIVETPHCGTGVYPRSRDERTPTLN